MFKELWQLTLAPPYSRSHLLCRWLHMARDATTFSKLGGPISWFVVLLPFSKKIQKGIPSLAQYVTPTRPPPKRYVKSWGSIQISGSGSGSPSGCAHAHTCLWNWGPIYKISYHNLMIMPKLRSTYDGRLFYKTSYEGRKAFLRYDTLANL